MVEINIEESKESEQEAAYEEFMKEDTASIEEEKKVYDEFVIVKEQVPEKDIEVEDLEQKRFRKQNCQRKKKKKKKKKETKQEYIAAFFKQVDLKAFNQKPMLPVEEYFSKGDIMPISKRDDFSLILRLIQTHFKAFPNELKPKQETTQLVSEKNQKFYEKRYYLFSKYDQGIQLDEESKSII